MDTRSQYVHELQHLPCFRRETELVHSVYVCPFPAKDNADKLLRRECTRYACLRFCQIVLGSVSDMLLKQEHMDEQHQMESRIRSLLASSRGSSGSNVRRLLGRTPIQIMRRAYVDCEKASIDWKSSGWNSPSISAVSVLHPSSLRSSLSSLLSFSALRVARSARICSCSSMSHDFD